MPRFTLRWANRSHSDQDWMISVGDNFHLRPNYVRTVQVTINRDFTYQIVVSTNGGHAAANLTYTAATNTWTLNSHTPNEWQLQVGNNIVTVRCLLEDVNEDSEMPDYLAGLPKLEEKLGGAKYPAYQLYKDNNRITWCSKKKVKGHDEGNNWIKACLQAHPGTKVLGKPWISDNQSGTIWP